jgi:hypothetical protein
MTPEPSVTTRFLARLLADSVADKPEELAAEHVANDERLARGEARGIAIAEELRRVEQQRETGTPREDER